MYEYVLELDHLLANLLYNIWLNHCSRITSISDNISTMCIQVYLCKTKQFDGVKFCIDKHCIEFV